MMTTDNKKEAGQNKSHNRLVGVLDLGTTKVCCLIASVSGDGKLEIVGVGNRASKGIRGGFIIDMDDAEKTIRTTVEAAERMAGGMIEKVVVNLSGGHPASKIVACETPVPGHEIGDLDIWRVLEQTNHLPNGFNDHDVVHMIPVGYTVDGTRGVRDPRGMYGERLGVNMHVVSASANALRNLDVTVNRCHLDIEEKIISPYASALSCLVEDEKRLGAVHIDMGGGTTSIAVFFDGELVHVDVIPVGGGHVTNDIAQGLSTPLSASERLKTLYGNALSSPSDDRETVRVPMIGDGGVAEESQVPRSILVGIIKPRIEETFELVRSRLESSGFDKVGGSRVVLSGGASQLPGTRELAALVLNKTVRLARPHAMPGLAEAISGPAFSTAVGLLDFTVNNEAKPHQGAYRPMEGPVGRFGRLGQWIRENF
jgi:cell division protein FtsA